MKFSIQIDNFLERAANDRRLLPSHLSLFMAIFYYRPAGTTTESFHVCRRDLMRFARIKSIVTYHKCLNDLVEYDYIGYNPTYNRFLASQVCIKL
jgi:hypothetical protein